MSFSSLDWDILIYSFQKILSAFSNFPLLKTFEVWNCENMENTLKIKVFIKSILFCKYLRNGSLDLYEILCGGQLLSCELRFQILWRSVHKWAHTSCKRARAFYRGCARLWLVHAHLSSDLNEIINLSSQDSNWPQYKISWRPELPLRRYLQNNIDFMNTLIFNVFPIFSQFHTSKVFQSGKLLNFGN